MTDSIFATLLNTIDGHTTGDVARALTQPWPVRRGMESSIAAVLSGLAANSNDSAALQRIIDMVPSTGDQAHWSQMAVSISDPNSPLMEAGRRMVPALFGSRENAVTSGISRASNLSPSAVTTLLTMAGPIVMSFIAKKLRDGEMTMDSLRAALQSESATIRNALPAGLNEAFWPSAPTTTTISPVVAQSVHRESRASWLVPALIAGAVALGLIWLFGRPPAPTGDASRAVLPASKAGCTLPGTATMRRHGLASRFLSFIRNRRTATTEFNADQLKFDTGSAQLRPEAQAQLNDLAALLKSCPDIRVKVVGHTDSVGDAAANLRLSRNRANTVVSRLERKGISADRLVAEGVGDQEPIADNATPQGRAKNRRITLLVT